MSDGKEKAEENETGAASSPPEVDAEVVTEETLAADSDDSETEETVETEAAEPSEEAPPAKRKSTLTPGVILFIIFAVTALAIFAAWRFQSGPVERAAPEEASAETPRETVVEDAPSKIANDSVSTGKPADLPEVTIGAASQSPALPEGDAKVGVEEGNLGFQRAAKEAFLSGAGDTDDSTEATEGPAPAFEVETADDKADQAETPEAQIASSGFDQSQDVADAMDIAAPNDTDTDDSVTELEVAGSEASNDIIAEAADPSEAGASSVDNAAANTATAQTEELQAKIAALELTLSEQRTRNARQRDEIETMRRQFEEALAERDRAAGVRMADLAARLDKIENGGTVEASRRAAAALALGAVQRVSDSGEPFAAELDVLAAYVPEGRNMAILRRYAETSVPSARTLAEDFTPAAREAIAAAHRDAAKTPLGKLGARVGNLISIRPAEPVAGDNIEAIISRAEAQIEAGDVGAGVAELETLPDPAREAMSPWMQQAASRVAVDQAIASLSDRLAPAVR